MTGKFDDRIFRALIENSYDGVAVVGAAGETIYLSPTMEHILGYPEDEIAKDNCFQLVHPDFMETAQKMFENFISGAVEFQSIEIKMKHKNGNYIWVEANATNMLKNPEIKGIVINFRDIDEKKQAEETLNFNAMVFDQISDHIVVTDIKGRVRYCNDTVLKTLKRERHEIIGNEVKFFGDNPQKGASQDEIADSVRKDGSWEGEVVNYDSQGNEIIMSAKVQTVKDSSGKPIAMVGVSRDITEKKKTEQELRESEEKFKQFFNEHSAVKLIFDLESGNVVEANKAAEKFYGWTVEELKGMRIFDINTDPEELTRENMNNVLITGERHFFFKHRKKDGSIADVEVFSSTVNIEGKYHAYSIIHDISDKKEAERQLRESEEKFRSLFHDHSAIKFIIDTDNGNIVDANKAAADFYDWSEDELKNMNISQINTDPESYTKENMQKAFNSGQNHFLFNHRKKDGSIVNVEVFSSRVEIKGKKYVHSVILDITEKKKAEEELKKIEWMLSRDPSDRSAIEKNEDQGYGDITELNRGGVISSSIDKDTLRNIASEYLDLMETSSAIYEKNGDYAYGIFCSGWCRMMDSASRKLCKTDDNEAALNSGKWLCHESCWTDCSKKAIELQKPVDIECIGGIRLYVVPIFSEGEVIGAINFGYGEPPKGIEKLNALADQFGLDREKVINEAKRFDSRPKYIIELAKQRLLSSAQLIGMMVGQKKVEQELQKSNRIFNHAVDMLCIAGFDGYFKTLNPSWEKVLGWSKEELLSKPWLDFVHPEDIEKTKNVKAVELRNGRQVYNFENRYICKDGSVKWLSWNSFPYPEDEIMFGVARDITERKKAENKLKVLVQILDIAPASIIVHDRNGKLFYANNNALKIHGYDNEQEFFKNNLKDLVVPDVAEKIEQRFKEIEKKGYSEFESEHYRKDGTIFNVKVYVNKSEWKGVPAYISIDMDITEKKKAEQELRESEEKFRKLADSSTAGIFIRCGDKFEYVNNTVCKNTGFSKEELYEMNTMDLFFPEDQDWLVELWQKRIDGEDVPDIYEARLKTKDGGFIWAAVSGNIIEYKGRPALIGSAFNITEKKEAEKKVEAMAQMLDVAPASITVHDEDGNFYYVNKITLDMHGYEKAEEFLKINLKDLDIPESVEKLEERFKEINEKGEARFESGHYRKDGSSFPLDIYARKTNWYGKPALISVAMDITERKKADRELRESEEKFRQLAESSTAGIFIHSGDTFEYVNETTSKHTGFSREELLKMKFIDIIYPEDRKMVMETWQKRSSGGSVSESYEARLNTKSGDPIWAVISGNLINYKGKPSLIGTAFNITEKKKAEEELKKSNRIFNHAVDLLCIAGFDGYFLTLNPAWEKTLGWSKEELLSKKLIDFLHPDDMEKTKNINAAELTKGKNVYNFENRYICKDGSVKWLSWNSFPYPEEKIIFGVARDVTEQKKIEAESKKLQEQLLQSQKMESVGRLAGGVAHDFNNMLSVILGRSEIALNRADPESKIGSDLKEIKIAAERSADLTAQLLAFARKQVVSPKVVSINDEINSFIGMLDRLIGEDVKLSFNGQKDLRNIRIDPSQISQILTNLCVNAKDAGASEITIRTDNSTDQTGAECVVVKVEDNGTGMDDQMKNKIFEPFFTTKELGKGTGLGLSTIYGIVQQNNGSVSVKSEIGKGTVFNICFPAVKEKREKKQVEKKSERSASSGGTILLVEDEETILDMTTMMLQEFGYEVVAASTPGEAINTAIENPGNIDLILTDVVMPEMNGRDLVKKIMNYHPDIKSVFMSGYTAEVIASKGILDEDMNFLHKPFSMAKLKEKIEQVLRTES